MRSSLTIKRRLIITFVALFATSTTLMGVFSYRSAMNHLHEELKDLARNENRLFYTILTADAKGLARAQIGLSRLDPQLRLFARQDREGLLNATRPIFTEIRQKNNITHMYFINPDGTVFLRMHKPEQFGDRLTRATYLTAKETDQTAYGLEMGKNFFSLRCVTPVFYLGKAIGFIEVAEEIDHIFQQMKEITGNDVSVFLKEDYLQSFPTELQSEKFGAFAILYPTNQAVSLQLAAQLQGTIKQGLAEYTVAVVDLQGGKYLVGMGPIRDAFGTTAGLLFSQKNVSSRYAAMWQNIAASVALFAAIFIASAVLLYLSLRKSIALFNALRDHIVLVTTSWNLTRRLEVSTDDEIGELAADFNRMTEKLDDMVTQVVKEMTEQKKAEEKIRKLNEELELKAAELVDSNRDLEAFSYSLSHDLRSPLTRIYSSAQLLQDQYEDVLDEDGRYLLDTICSAGAGMEQLIEAMLVLAQVTKSELLHEEVDLSEIALEVAAELLESEPERRVEFVIAPDMVAQGDPQILPAALKNLVGNAWKYTSKASHPRIEVGSLLREGEKVFFVRDNGAGFDMQDAELIFKPFYRHHEAKEFPGLGIGLATVQRIIQRHGGRVWAEGKPGEGAAFYFTLP